MANPIAESILALLSGGAQGYVGARAKRQGVEEENQRYLDEIARRREERAAAGQEAATERSFRAGEAEKTRAQQESQFGAEQKFAGEKFAFEKGRTEETDALKAQIRKEGLDAQEQNLRLLATIASLQGRDPRDYIAEAERKFYADIAGNADIKPEDAKARIKIYNDFMSALEGQTQGGVGGVSQYGPNLPSPDFSGYVYNPKTGGYVPPPETPAFSTTTAPWLQDLIKQMGDISSGNFIDRYVRKTLRKPLKTAK